MVLAAQTRTVHLVGLDCHKYVQVDNAYMRPADVEELRGDPSKAMARLGWAPTITFDELVYEMLENDLKLEGVDPTKHLREPPARVGP